jgi:hypothetical protein
LDNGGPHWPGEVIWVPGNGGRGKAFAVTHQTRTNNEMPTQMMETPILQSATAKGEGLTRLRLLALESQQAELGARLAGLEGVVFAIRHQLTEVRRDLREVLQATRASRE